MSAPQPPQAVSAKSSGTRRTSESGPSGTTERRASIVPPVTVPIGPGQSSDHLQQFSDHRRLSFSQDEHQEVLPQARGLKGRKMSTSQTTTTRRRSSAWQDTDQVVDMLYNGTLPQDYFDNPPPPAKSKPRRKSVAVPTYAYLSKDFVKEDSSQLPVCPEDAGPSSKRRGVNVEIRLQEAARRHHRRMSDITTKAREHFRKVEEVKLNNDEADEKELHRIDAATRNLFK